MLKGFNIIQLDHLISEIGENDVKSILLDFSCPNRDVENFLHNKAIEFSRQGLSKTYLVFTFYKEEVVLIGYYTLGQKIIVLSQSKLSGNWRKRISKFATFEPNPNRYYLGAVLIAQMSKNFKDGLSKMISGDELLRMAYETVIEIHELVGGRIVFVECEDNKKLIEFYQRNGFEVYGERKLDPDEIDLIPGEYLIQMIKYLRKP